MLTFADEDITSAMEHTAREYNSVPPYGVDNVRAHCMSADSALFLNGVAAVLLERKHRLMMTQAQEFTAGGISTDPDAKIRAGIAAEAQRLRAAFESEANARKRHKNIQSFYGRFN